MPITKYEAISAKLKESQDQALNIQNAHEKELRKVKEVGRAAQEEAEEARTDLLGLEREYKHAMQDAESKNATYERTIEDLRSSLERTASSLEATNGRLSKKEAEAGQLESENLRLKAQTGDADTLAVIKRELSDQVAHIRKLESTNRDQTGQLKILRQKQKAVEVVEEEKRALEARLGVIEDLRKELREAQLQRQILEDEQRSWTSYLHSQGQGGELVEFDSPEDMARALIKERLENASFVDKIGALQPVVMEKDQIIRGLEEQAQKTQTEIETLKGGATTLSVGTDSRTKKALERQRALALKEVEFLREQLRTFDSEEQTYHSAEQSQFDAIKTARITDLEQQLDAHRSELASLTASFSTLEAQAAKSTQNAPRSPLKRSREDDEEDDDRFGQLSRKNRKLQNEISTLSAAHTLLETEHSALKAQLTALRNSAKTRVLSLRSNPTDDYAALKLSTLNTLKQENKDLLAQLETRAQEDLGQNSANFVPASTLAALRIEIQELEKTVADKEKRMLRLKQIWGAKAQELREAVLSLLGWQMEFRPNGKFALSLPHPDDQDGEVDSEYEARGEESLIFDGENGTMKVAGGMDCAFARELRPLTKEWVERKRFIPGLMASVLLRRVGDGRMTVD